VIAAPSRDTPANTPLEREKVYMPEFTKMGTPTCALRPTAPAAAEASPFRVLESKIDAGDMNVGWRNPTTVFLFHRNQTVAPTSTKNERALFHTWKDGNGTGAAKPALWPEIFQNLGRFSSTPGLAFIDERQISWSDAACRLIWLLPLHRRLLLHHTAVLRFFRRSTAAILILILILCRCRQTEYRQQPYQQSHHSFSSFSPYLESWSRLGTESDL
jgi:hypothetical protein